MICYRRQLRQDLTSHMYVYAPLSLCRLIPSTLLPDRYKLLRSWSSGHLKPHLRLPHHRPILKIREGFHADEPEAPDENQENTYEVYVVGSDLIGLLAAGSSWDAALVSDVVAVVVSVPAALLLSFEAAGSFGGFFLLFSSSPFPILTSPVVVVGPDSSLSIGDLGFGLVPGTAPASRGVDGMSLIS